MSLGRRRPQQFVLIDRHGDNYRLTCYRDERMRRVGSDENPFNRLDVIIVRSVQGQMLIGQQPQMGVRHRRRMSVVWITAMHVGERRLSEA